MTKHLTLTASLDVAGPRAQYLTASSDLRQIAGRIVEYGVIGYASTGETIFEPDSLKFPPEGVRVKFLLQHDTERPLGTMQSLDQHDATAAAGTFNVAAGALGDEALAMAEDGRRDGLSVGCMILDYSYDDKGVLHVRAAEVTEVSLVTIPAFRSSLVSTVSASMKAGHDMTKQLTKVQPFQLTASQSEGEPETPPAAVEAAQTPVQPAAAPAPASPATFARPTTPQADPVAPSTALAHMDLTAAAGKAAQYLAAHQPAAGLTAALTDAVPADDAGEGFLRPQWVGELWQASRVARPTIESIQRKTLTGLKVYGFRKVVDPSLVNKYGFNKGEVPASGKVKTVPVETDAMGYAGGWDVDRRFVDLGDGSYIQSVLEAATDDYKEDTEADAVAAMLAAATVVTLDPGAGAVAALTELGVRAAGLGSSISKIQFAPDVWAEFVSLAPNDVPWWLQKQGEVRLGETGGNAGGMSFNVNQELPAGTILGHDSRAATWYEHGETPINVQAVDIARGGIDLGVYGYGAILINDARAIFKVTLTPAP